MGRFVNPFTDEGFKIVFGQEISKPLLLDFLNTLLEGEEHIVDLTFSDKEQVTDYEDDRLLIYDVFALRLTVRKSSSRCRTRSKAISKSVAFIICREPYRVRAKKARSGVMTSRQSILSPL